MKKSLKFLAVIFLVSILSNNLVYAQATLKKAYYTGLYFYADLPFTWSGGSSDGYCNGYGTLQFYENGNAAMKYVGYVKKGVFEGYGSSYRNDGSTFYVGNWSNNQMHGYGISYYENGNVFYQGQLYNNEIPTMSSLKSVAAQISQIVVSESFDGGSNVNYDVEKIIYDREGQLKELSIRLTFYGNINTSNYYACTIAMSDYCKKVNYLNCNDRAANYLKTVQNVSTFIDIIKVIDYLDKNL